MGTVLIDLDGSLSGEPNKIMSWHRNIEPDNVQFFQCPPDFSFDKYYYVPQTQGVFDLNGFVLKPIIED